jgi:formamidopyrimidine-DNA glycosylase
MNSPGKALSRSEIEAQSRREAREKKPTRQWTVAERREAFSEARNTEHKNAESVVVKESDLCDECHENTRERGTFWCRQCIDRGRQYAD